MKGDSFSLIGILLLYGVLHLSQHRLFLVILLHCLEIVFPTQLLNILQLVLQLLVTLALVKLIFRFRLFEAPLLDFINLAELIHTAFVIDFILNRVPGFLILSKLLLVNLEKLLALAELYLLFFEFFTHKNFTIASGYSLRLIILE